MSIPNMDDSLALWALLSRNGYIHYQNNLVEPVNLAMCIHAIPDALYTHHRVV